MQWKAGSKDLVKQRRRQAKTLSSKERGRRKQRRRHPINQSTTQVTKEPTTKVTKEPTDQSTSQSTHTTSQPRSEGTKERDRKGKGE